jgi:hypothetical protein
MLQQKPDITHYFSDMAVLSHTKAGEYSSNSREGKTITISNTTTIHHYCHLPTT